MEDLDILTLFLGDSYTIGESVDEVEGWPIQLVSALRDKGLAMAEPMIVAQSGWTTKELAAGIEHARIDTSFDLVSLLIGVNDQYQNQDIEEYRIRFRRLLKMAIAFANHQPWRVMVLSIPDWGATPFAEGCDRKQVASEIDHFNQINRQETEELEARYIDVTTISRQAFNDPSLIAEDELHPSSKMYGAWVSSILPVVLEILDQ